MDNLTLEWNDKFSGLYSWYEIQDLIAELEWDLPPQDLLDYYIYNNQNKITNNIWVNKVHFTLKKVAQVYNYKLGIYDFQDKNKKCSVILYRNPDKIRKYQMRMWLVCNSDLNYIKKYNSFDNAEDDLSLICQKQEGDFFLLETKNLKKGRILI
jgi:hypothetical protein